MTHSTHEVGRRSAKSWAGFFGAAAMLALFCVAVNPRLAHSADKDKGQQISRVIAKEMTAAQKALQAGQWADAIKNLEAAQTKTGLTPFDEKTIYYFTGFANIKLNNLKAAQAAFEKSIATGAASPEDKNSMTHTLFTIAATTNQYQKTIDYGKEMTDAGTATPNDVAIMAQSYYQLKDCKSASVWADKAVAAARKDKKNACRK